MKQIFTTCFFIVALIALANAQNGTIRGFVYDSDNGEPILFGNVYLQGTTIGGSTDINGFFSINKVAAGDYTLLSTYIGYDTAKAEISVREDGIVNQNLYLKPQSTTLGVIEISAEKAEAKTEVKTSVIKITPKLLNKIPTIGGSADLVQYLQIVPGIIFSGDQGGQLYVRGGSAIQTKVLLDGITVYNPFHSIGFFSVFETDLIRNVDVLTGGFDAEYGGRISAVIDIKTKDGNKKRTAGKVSVSPFLSKVIVEGPIKKLDENQGGSISYLITSKYSYLNESSKLLYNYIADEGLPYSFLDVYGKLSMNSANGTKANFYGYNFTDDVAFVGQSTFGWDAFGLGGNFVLVPGQSKTLIDGSIAYSQYDISLLEANDTRPRVSEIGGFDAAMNFTYFLNNNQKIKYGINIGGFSTNFKFRNLFETNIDQKNNTTEMSAYFKFRGNIGEKLVYEPSFRVSFYPSLSTVEPEPRIGIKYNINNRLRFKAAAGIYTQNFISTKSDRDVVNLFTGFLSGPESDLIKPNGKEARNNIQKATHFVAGLEIDVTRELNINIEGYYKKFNQLINLNRDKQFDDEPDYVLEEGNAYGIDFLAKYDYKRLFIWGVYSLAFTNRFDGITPTPETAVNYAPHYDRRHNFNFTTAYQLGSKLDWEASVRWNYGSGFPFTKTQGFYELLTLDDGIFTDVISQNGALGIIYDENINTGRLPDYHRLDASLKKNFTFSKNSKLEVVASVTNVYDRDNIFYFDRVKNERIDQLPILPSVGMSFTF